MTLKEWIGWLHGHLEAAERVEADEAVEVAQLVCTSSPKVGRRVGEVPGGALFAFTVGDLRRLLSRAERSAQAREIATEATSCLPAA